MLFDQSEFYNYLISSLREQKSMFQNQLILNPVENIPDSKYLSHNMSFLYGMYNSDKLRSEEEMLNTKIQFANRGCISYDINQIYDAWCNILNASFISMRFFSGLHAHTTVFMSITDIDDCIVSHITKFYIHLFTFLCATLIISIY